jgi:excisionase family DNA binding protein
MQPDPRARTYTIGEVAVVMRVSTRTVRRWIAMGLLGGTKIRGVLRIVPEDLIEMVDAHRLVPPAA